MHFVSWIFKIEFIVRVEIDELCPANDCESFIVIVACNWSSELVALPACFSFYKWYWTIGFFCQASVAPAFDATIFDIAQYS